MGLFDRLKSRMSSQFIDIIEWLDDSAGTMVHRFPVADQEIKNGARLTVRENQLALLVNEGKAADLFRPGLHALSTRNVPVLATLRGWKHGFESPFKAEVYFFNTRLFTDLKWGTSQPVLVRDQEFGMVRLRAFGTYAVRLAEARTFFAQVVGTRGLTTTEEITGQLRSIILTRFSDALAEARVPVLDVATRFDELSEMGRGAIDREFRTLGLELARFFVESVSLPDEVQAAVDHRSRLGVLGGHLDAFTRLQAAEAMTLAASAEGGAAGAGVGIGAGMAMGRVMGEAMAPAGGRPGEPPPPPAAPRAAAARWSLNLSGANQGPYTDETVRGMVLRGELDPAALAWKPGAAGWAPLSSYPEFADFNAPPPPSRRGA
ncbi:MAG TPA: SPFH domain-containing protein [Candidatus Polarisedimenticolia bacterium]|nr:SPFH domain-containing protein [Candidatus Polarisedimenticolia bacterium]